MDEKHVCYLLKRFTENSLTDKEYIELQTVFQEAEFDPAISKFMDTVWDSLETSIPFTRMRSEIVYDKIIHDQRFIDAKPSNSNSRNRIPVWTKIAASFLLVGTLALWANQIYFNKPVQIEYAQYKTPAGSRLKIDLPDGSRVWLNAASSIRFPKDFNDTSRHVQLEGEAFFDVAHDVTRPFVVYTNNVNTRVLGTAFNISSYNKESVTVTVVRGKVKVNDEHKQLGVLIPNHQLEYNLKTKIAASHEVKASLYKAWADGELVLNNITMEEAASILSRWYNVNFVFKDPGAKKCRFVASFPANADLGQVLKVISKLNNFQYKIANKSITITGKGCAQN